MLVWHSGNARECAYYFRPRELLLVEMFPKVVGLKDTWDDIEDVFPPGIRLAKQRLSTFFAWRLASVDKARAAAGGRQASGRPRVRYGQAGECSDATGPGVDPRVRRSQGWSLEWLWHQVP